MPFSVSPKSLYTSPRLYQAYGSFGSSRAASSSAARAGSSFCWPISETPRFSPATANFGSASSACSKNFCASAGRCWFIYATPRVLKRYASVGFAAAAGFFEAAAFSCPRDALERMSSGPKQIKNEKIETATALRQRPGRMNFLFLSARRIRRNTLLQRTQPHWNSPGCPTYRQPFCQFLAVLSLPCLTFPQPPAYSHASGHANLRLLHPPANRRRHPFESVLPRRNHRRPSQPHRVLRAKA